ncbi:AMP-binding protein [Aquicella lusitana]|uniref:AMP-binding protein n=1 Tax=Aquicella lusitana TaxID=254246 RepID=UPI0011C02FDE|nr:AMP-binding protein [Aquicella lusitana]
MEKIWLKSYPQGVPAEINPDAYQSLAEVIEQSCQQFRDRPAFYNMGVSLTYAQLDEYSREFAAYLQHELKLKKGDRLAIMLPNILQYPIVLFGALRAGLVVVNVNPLYTADELAYQLNNSGAATIVALTNFASTVQKALPRVSALKNVIITDLGDLFSPFKRWMTHLVLKYIYKKIPQWDIPGAIPFRKALARGKELPFIKVPLTNNDTAFLQYTGGTTGVSKGAILTHRNVIANLQQADAWFRSLLSEGQETIITALPLYHIFSLTANALFFSKIGGLNVLITNPRDIPGSIREMKKFKFTAITGVNTLFNALMKDPAFATLDFSRLRLTLGGGMAVQRAVAEKWQKLTGAPLLEAYGLTETSPCVTINPANLDAYNGTIGLPVSSTDVCILDENGHEVPIGQPGELAVKGPQVMKGYWQNPAETEKVFTKDGWLLTGDIAKIDEQGFIRLLERKKDMILISGFNVYPNEVEDVLAKLPGIREVAVVGLPDEYSGEIAKAFIVKDDPNLTKDDIFKYAHEHLTPYKVPKQIEFCDELPKTNVGKILRRALRDAAVNK